MGNSSLASYTRISPNSNNPRNNKVLKITPHHQAGNLTLPQFGAIVANPAREMSSNYAIDSAGNIGLFCEEKNRSWCSSSPTNDHQAITVEIANDGGAPDWHVSDRAIDALIRLSVDICQRNGIKKVIYTGTTAGNLTRHNMFAATLCPGPYLQSKLPYIEATVNARLNSKEDITMPMSTNPVRMWLGPMSGGDRQKFVNALNEKKIAFVEDQGKLITVPAVSPGDQTGLMQLAITTGNIGYGPQCPDVAAGVPQSTYDAMVRDRDIQKRDKDEALKKISTATLAANSSVAAAQSVVTALK